MVGSYWNICRNPVSVLSVARRELQDPQVRRLLAKALGVTASRLNDRATVQYAKVGEYQRRGIIHFHALIRLDGPKTDQGSPAPDLSADELADLVRDAVASVRFTTPLVDGEHRPGVLAFGAQVDARRVRPTHRPDEPGEGLNAEQVAG
jgi:hypothetical protein